MADSSFDIVSKVDRQEVDNALNQAAKELATRFDFRGTDTKIAWKGDEAIELTSSTEERVKAAVDVFKEKLIRRDISMKAFDAGEPQASGKTYKVSGTLKQGIDSVNQTQARATDLATKFERGVPGVELPQVMLEMQKANVSFRALTEVRNKFVDAYREIMNMPL